MSSYTLSHSSKRLSMIPLVVAVTAMIAVWIYSVGNPLVGWRQYQPAGQQLYLFSKATGLIGITLLAFQWLYAIWKPFLAGNWRLSPGGHRKLGLTCALFIFLHVVFFLIAVWLRQKHIPLGLFVPGFSHGYYKTGLSLGLIGFFGLALTLCVGVVLSVWYGRWLEQLHRVATLLITPAIIHGAIIGSEVDHPFVMTFGMIFILLYLVGIVSRVWGRLRYAKI